MSRDQSDHFLTRSPIRYAFRLRVFAAPTFHRRSSIFGTALDRTKQRALRFIESSAPGDSGSSRTRGCPTDPGRNPAESGRVVRTRFRHRRKHGWDDNRLQFQRRLGIEFADSIFAKANRSSKKFPLGGFRRRVAGMAGGRQREHGALSRRRIRGADRAGAGGESRFAGKHRCHTQGGRGARKNCA